MENKTDSVPKEFQNCDVPSTFGTVSFFWGAPSMEQPKLVMKFLTVLGAHGSGRYPSPRQSICSLFLFFPGILKGKRGRYTVYLPDPLSQEGGFTRYIGLNTHGGQHSSGVLTVWVAPSMLSCFRYRVIFCWDVHILGLRGPFCDLEIPFLVIEIAPRWTELVFEWTRDMQH